jgi:hypothetical protein
MPLILVVAPKTAIVMTAIPVPTTFVVVELAPSLTILRLVTMVSGAMEPTPVRVEVALINTLVMKDVLPERPATNRPILVIQQAAPATMAIIPAMSEKTVPIVLPTAVCAAVVAVGEVIVKALSVLPAVLVPMGKPIVTVTPNVSTT